MELHYSSVGVLLLLRICYGFISESPDCLPTSATNAPSLLSTANVSACPALRPPGHRVCCTQWTERGLGGASGWRLPWTWEKAHSQQEKAEAGAEQSAHESRGHQGQCGLCPGLSTSLYPQQTLLSRRRDHSERYPSQTVGSDLLESFALTDERGESPPLQ